MILLRKCQYISYFKRFIFQSCLKMGCVKCPQIYISYMTNSSSFRSKLHKPRRAHTLASFFQYRLQIRVKEGEVVHWRRMGDGVHVVQSQGTL